MTENTTTTNTSGGLANQIFSTCFCLSSWDGYLWISIRTTPASHGVLKWWQVRTNGPALEVLPVSSSARKTSKGSYFETKHPKSYRELPKLDFGSL